MNTDAIGAPVERLRKAFRSGRTKPLAWRRRQLQALRRLLDEREPEFARALQRDLGKPPLETLVTELGLVRGEVDLALRNLRRWTRGERLPVPLSLQPARARIVPVRGSTWLSTKVIAPLCGKPSSFASSPFRRRSRIASHRAASRRPPPPG